MSDQKSFEQRRDEAERNYYDKQFHKGWVCADFRAGADWAYAEGKKDALAFNEKVTLPDCMMPDGADPCEGFKRVYSELDALKQENSEAFEKLQKLDEAAKKYDPDYLKTSSSHVVDAVVISLARGSDLRDENNWLTQQLSDAEKENEELHKANGDMAQEAFLAKKAIKDGFEAYVYEEMECRGDEDCDHCVINEKLEEDKESIKALSDEVAYLTQKLSEAQKENEGLKQAIEDRDKMHAQHVNTIEAERFRTLAALKEAVGALEKIKHYVSCYEMTNFPVNVREPDGSISQHRPKSNAGHACDLICETLDKLKAQGEGK